MDNGAFSTASEKQRLFLLLELGKFVVLRSENIYHGGN